MPTRPKIPTPLRIFLCHSSGDKLRVHGLYSLLSHEGFSPWLDEVDILPGQDWELEIRRVIKSADIVLVCLSQDSVTKTGFVQKEIKYALDIADEQPEGTIFLIPVKLEPCTVPDRLRSLHWVDLQEPGGEKRLLLALRQRADALRMRQVEREPDRLEHRVALAQSYIRSGDLHHEEERYAPASRFYQQAIEIYEELVARQPFRNDLEQGLSAAYESLAELSRTFEFYDQAVDYFRRSLRLREEAARREPVNLDSLRELAVFYQKIGSLYGEIGRTSEAGDFLDKARRTREDVRARVGSALTPPSFLWLTLDETLTRAQTGRIHTIGPLNVPGLKPRLVRVYLPTTYGVAEASPVLYLFDGQNVFDDEPSFAGGWHIHEAVERMARSGRPTPVVVGIDHGGEDRDRELSPFSHDGVPGGLDLLLDWMAGDLMPSLISRLRLHPGAILTSIGGAALGGLAALYAHFRYPELFGGALALSPLLDTAGEAVFETIANLPAPEFSRIYLDAGAKEDRGRLMPLVTKMAGHLADRGWDSDSLMWRPDPRGTHSEAAWRRRLPRALRFLYR